MKHRPRAQISLRKQPQQTRSAALVDAVLDAAVQVLAAEGAGRFTMARVAARAGASVGSLYQYFPNKAAILFRLQREEWRRTQELLRDILEDSRRPPAERLRALVHAFVRSECEEAAMRVALEDAAPLYRDAPETRKAREGGTRIFRAFMREVLPRTPEASRELAGDLLKTTLSQVGKSFSQARRTSAEITVYADAMADMFCAYVEKLRRARGGG